MFPRAVPRLVFGLALLWAWLNMPVPIYGTLWLLALAYFTVMLPLGVRTLAGVVLQIDKSLEECARVCGAGWVYQMRTVTLPLLKPGMLAAWLLIFMACVRELGASVFLMGPNAKVIAPSIVAAFASSGTELTAALAVLATVARGLRQRKQGGEALQANVGRALDLGQMRHLPHRGASKLSGAQQQRGALARPIAFSPTAGLLDEPLSNLDAKLRAEM